MRKIFVSTMFVFVGLLTAACPGKSMMEPTPIPLPVMAPPPAGVSPEVWEIAFMGGRLFRPVSEAVHFDVSGLNPDVQSIWAEMALVLMETVQRKTTFDLIPGGPGATIMVSIEEGLLCNGLPAGGCTGQYTDPEGHITGGRIRLSSVNAASYRPVVLHEMIHAIGVSGHNPKQGIMSARLGGSSWPHARVSDEERLMLLGRYDYPLLAQFSPQ